MATIRFGSISVVQELDNTKPFVVIKNDGKQEFRVFPIKPSPVLKPSPFVPDELQDSSDGFSEHMPEYQIEQALSDEFKRRDNGGFQFDAHTPVSDEGRPAENQERLSCLTLLQAEFTDKFKKWAEDHMFQPKPGRFTLGQVVIGLGLPGYSRGTLALDDRELTALPADVFVLREDGMEVAVVAPKDGISDALKARNLRKKHNQQNL